eukprot:jgi/Astpho2/3585/e_gw1.00058.23.1_t
MPTLQEHEDPNSEGSSPGLAPERQGGPVSTSAAGLQLPRETVTKLRGTLSHPSEFWVTSVENYEANGVLFKGNLRAKDVQKAYASTASRLKDQIGDEWSLFLMQDKEEKPVLVVLPAEVVQDRIQLVPESMLATLFAGVTLVTTLTTTGGTLQALEQGATLQDALLGALPGALAFFGLLGAHEAGHRVAAAKHGVKLSPPFLLPSALGLLGSFGAITRFRSTVPNRQADLVRSRQGCMDALLQIAAYGPAFGAAASLAAVLVGLGLSAAGVGGGITVQSSAFEDSLLLGLLGKLFLGARLASTSSLQVNALALAGYAGLTVNAINLIPMGELDGARVAFGLWGRRCDSLSNLAVASCLVEAVTEGRAVALYWLLLVLFLQRGPILPQQEELSEPADTWRPLGIALLFLPLLVLIPFPFSLTASEF